MSRPRGIVAAVLVLGAVVVPRAEAEYPEWTLVGSRTAYVDVTLDVDATLREPVVTTKGRYAGVYARQLTYRYPAHQDTTWGDSGWVAIRGLSSDPARLDPVHLGSSPYFYAGRIRLYLIADGPTTVTVPVQYSGRPSSREFRPRERAAARVSVTRLTAREGVWSASMPVRLGSREVALAALQVKGGRSVLADGSLCVRSRYAACETPTGQRVFSEEAGDSPVGPLDPERRWRVTVLSRAGDAIAEARVEPLEPLSHAVLAVFALSAS